VTQAKTVASDEKPKLKEKPPPDRRIYQGSWQLYEHTNYTHRLVAPAGFTAADYDLDPIAFEPIAANISKLDRAILVDADEKWAADMLCVDAGPGYAIFKVLNNVQLPPRRSSEGMGVPEGYEIVQAGITEEGEWIVRRKATAKEPAVQLHSHPIWRWPDALTYLLNHATVRQGGGSVKFNRIDD
jgi:hypothetical protein